MLRLRTLNTLATAAFSRTNVKTALSDKLGYKSLQLNTRTLRHQNTAAAEPFLNGSSSIYIEEMYQAWQQDPNSVHKVCVDYI